MDPLRSLDPDKLKAAGYGTERPWSDHPEVLRNLLLRGGHEEWCHVILRTQNEPDFQKLLQEVLQTIPYPPAWEYPGSDDPEGDPDVESAARPVFQRLLEHLANTKSIKQAHSIKESGHQPETADALRTKAWMLATRHALRDFVDVATLTDHFGQANAVSILKDLNHYFRDTTRTSSLQNFVEACHLPPSDWNQFLEGELSCYKGIIPPYNQPEYLKKTCRNLADELLTYLPQQPGNKGEPPRYPKEYAPPDSGPVPPEPSD